MKYILLCLFAVTITSAALADVFVQVPVYSEFKDFRLNKSVTQTKTITLKLSKNNASHLTQITWVERMAQNSIYLSQNGKFTINLSEENPNYQYGGQLIGFIDGTSVTVLSYITRFTRFQSPNDDWMGQSLQPGQAKIPNVNW